MHNILRYIRQNRKKIIRIIIIIVSFIGFLQLLNYMEKNKNKEISGNANDYNDIYNTSNGTILSDKSAVSGATVSREKIENTNNEINKFVDYCNNQDIESAYNMLSDNCKEQMYPNIEIFKSNYYNGLFGDEKRTYTIENWIENIYIVKYTGDLLATGKSIDNFTYQDYMTVEKDKININKYIGREEINKTSNSNNIAMTVLSKEKYMDYEIYKIEVTNNMESAILLDMTTDKDTLYIKDSNNVKHNAFNNELVKEDLRVYQGETKIIDIKFDNPYISSRKIKSLNFSNIYLNYANDNYALAQTIKFTIQL